MAIGRLDDEFSSPLAYDAKRADRRKREHCAKSRSMRDFVAHSVLIVVFSAFSAAFSVQDSLSPCPSFQQEHCMCSQDLKDIYCRAAGFTHVPQNLPISIIKL
ncbi:hypothetical protein JTB14_029666 [Gonioctena quinquepunctata]|nr:hypothetical protein JTB14_029666 [Gonioctena quinquepunctata]